MTTVWIVVGIVLLIVLALWSQSGAVESTKLKVGDRAPDFELASQSGEIIRLSDLLERGPVVLYFYIQDATPG